MDSEFRPNVILPLLRYKSLCPDTWPHYNGAAKDGVEVLVNHLQYSNDDYRLGKWVQLHRHYTSCRIHVHVVVYMYEVNNHIFFVYYLGN